MARKPSVILSVAEKKAMVQDLKKALKAHKLEETKISSGATAAQKNLSVAEKLAENRRAAVARSTTREVALAKKQLEATQARTAKMLAAAAKGRSKLEARLSALETAPVAPKAPKVAKAPKLAIVQPELKAA